MPQTTLKTESALKADIASLTLSELQQQLKQMGQPAYRALQLFKWIHAHGAESFEHMSNLPQALRSELAAQYTLNRPFITATQLSKDGTAKHLMQLKDANCIEAVWMEYNHGASVCVSSQVGCRMGCAFCASTVGGEAITPGLVRNLTAAEMAGQLYAAQAFSARKANHLVLMGIGEPLDNFDNVMDFISIITDKEGQNLSGRGISLSTCGIVPAINRLAEKNLQLTLSVSLHAANDQTRNRIMPVGRSWPLNELMAACTNYQKTTNRRISYEYALFRDVNDGEQDAQQLAQLLKSSKGHLNIIEANPVQGSGLVPTGAKQVQAFAARLNKLGCSTTVRRKLGADIQAACGQLRAQAAQHTQ